VAEDSKITRPLADVSDQLICRCYYTHDAMLSCYVMVSVSSYNYYNYYYKHFMALWILSGTTWVSQYQKVQEAQLNARGGRPYCPQSHKYNHAVI